MWRFENHWCTAADFAPVADTVVADGEEITVPATVDVNFDMISDDSAALCYSACRTSASIGVFFLYKCWCRFSSDQHEGHFWKHIILFNLVTILHQGHCDAITLILYLVIYFYVLIRCMFCTTMRLYILNSDTVIRFIWYRKKVRSHCRQTPDCSESMRKQLKLWLVYRLNRLSNRTSQ